MAVPRDTEAQSSNITLDIDSDVDHIVDFDGPDDPENARNWPLVNKTVVIALVSFLVMLSHVGSTISSPAAEDILGTFKSNSQSLGAFVTTIYLLGYASGPVAIGPLSELYGRALVYKICIVLFMTFNVGCAVANSLGALIALRLLAGIVASAPLSLGPGCIADLMPPEKRAAPMSAFMVGGVAGPMIGPIVGGYVTPMLGWRWLFWIMATASAAMAVLLVVFMRESYPYVLLKWKTNKLRKQTGDATLRSALDTQRSARGLLSSSIIRPIRMLASPIVLLLSLYQAVVYSYMYLAFTTFPRVFSDQYGFKSEAAGLATLGIGIGGLVGTAFCALLSRRLSAHLAKRNNGGTVIPEYQLPTLAVGGLCVPVGLFWYGWAAEAKAHWASPIVATGFLGAGVIITYMASTMYLIDAYTVHAASVSAAATILRCSCGALLPLAGNAMYDALGIGWGTSVLGFISVAFLPVPPLFYLYGQRIRESRRFQVTW